ncbi:MAG: selenocysteine-specific translation elongation factor [Acidimicrobiia bacterium]|jgi:selenocysteine-specific elongation factor
MPLIGTAGHVDHGKSTLIESLTGRDPDRWREEKQRGLTIDLGFAWAALPDGTEVSFVDVPGHERFLKNMLAGIEAIDVALFVVAADEGWKPQSEEHLAVLDLLEVTRGVVALTKTDLADPDLAELATAEIEEMLAGTTLEAAPIVPVSAVSGIGMSDLMDALAAVVPSGQTDNARPRLWVDRSFPIAGAGTVVTGSLLDGKISVDQTIEVYPGGRTGRIRSIQSHEKSYHTVESGRRVALNIGGVSHDEIERGDMIGLPDQWTCTNRVAVRMRPARFVDEIERRGAYQMHIGSSAHRVDITGLEEDVAVLQLDEELPTAVGDRFILRDTGRQLVVAGGRVLDPAPGRTKEALSKAGAIDPSVDADTIADDLLAIRGHDDSGRLETHSRGGRPRRALLIGNEAVHHEHLQHLIATAEDLVEADHKSHPLRPGLPLATLAEQVGASRALAERLVEESSRLGRAGPNVMVEGHSNVLTNAQERAWQSAEARLRERLAVPDELELGVDQEVIGLKIRAGELVRVGPGIVYLPEQIEEIKQSLASCGEAFTVAQFRDASGLSRKYAVPILEWCDKEGLTVRRGDIRSLR